MKQPFLLDSGFLYALLSTKDVNHKRVLAVAQQIYEPILLPTIVTPEVAYLVYKQMGSRGLADFLDALANDEYIFVEPISDDYRRAAEVVRQYSDSQIDFVDAVIVAMSERLHITRILTVDHRHFRMFRPRHCPAFELFPSS